MSILMGIIADDFTGASDIAGIIARAGVQVNLRIGTPTDDAGPNAGPNAGLNTSSGTGTANNPTDATAAFEVIALKCRNAPVEDAVAEVLAAHEWLRNKGARRYFWKYCSTFDSTDKGNIGPVAEALLEATGSRQTIYCPAFPENGRSIYMGNLFVDEQLLAESPMKDHPLTPMLDSNLVRLLKPQTTHPAAQITLPTIREGSEVLKQRLAQMQVDNITHVVLDAVAASDLKTITNACQHFPLITGGSALALHVPKLFAEQGLLDEKTSRFDPPLTSSGQIVLSGSCSAMTQKQVAEYKLHASHFQLDPLALARDGKMLDDASCWLKEQHPDAAKLIYATADPVSVARAQRELGREKSGAVVEHALATLALVALRCGVRRFVIAGGETSGAVTQELGISRLQIGQEISPGVPWTYTQVEGQNVALALKSGNFGSHGFFQDSLQLLA